MDIKLDSIMKLPRPKLIFLGCVLFGGIAPGFFVLLLYWPEIVSQSGYLKLLLLSALVAGAVIILSFVVISVMGHAPGKPPRFPARAAQPHVISIMTEYCFFKYRAINKDLLDSLVKSQLFFAPRNRLNDPFDCNIDISRALDHLLLSEEKDKTDLLRKLRNNDDELKRFNNNVDPLGICSFSLTPNETLMWSHYANDHKGICLRYDFPEALLNNGDEIFGVQMFHMNRTLYLIGYLTTSTYMIWIIKLSL